MPVPGPMRMSGVERFGGRRKSWVGFGKILTMGLGDDDSLPRKDEQMHSRYRVASPPILRQLLESPGIDGVR